jgi:hypothetical protein
VVQKKREILERLPASKGLKSLFVREKMKILEIKKLEKTKVHNTLAGVWGPTRHSLSLRMRASIKRMLDQHARWKRWGAAIMLH